MNKELPRPNDLRKRGVKLGDNNHVPIKERRSESEVNGFIGKFLFGKTVTETFMNGCCFWFAVILKIRFNGTLMYDEVENHFGTEINGSVYDIGGKTGEGYRWRTWNSFCESDPPHAQRIIRDCMLYID